MRSISLRQPSNNSARPQLQTKMKSLRGGELIDLKDSVDSHKFMQTHKSKHDHDFCVTNEDQFRQTASKLTSSNFGHHDENNCVCNDCSCGRHLCKLHVIKPDLTKNTVYQRSFYQQRAIPNIVNHDKEYDPLRGPHLDMNSTYHEGFKGKSGDKIERPRPEDLLKSSGPCPQLTTYSSLFPGFKGENQYVKPTDRHVRADFPLRSKSTYAKEYVKKDSMKDDYTYFPDQLRTNSNWFGKTTYDNAFNNPNPEYFAKKVKLVEKLDDKPDYSRQYETIYKNDFIPKQNPLCPAKILLETKAQGQFYESRGNFSENADFKSMSPEFHAISTSKHSYV